MMKDIKPWLIMGACCGLAASSLGISINSSGVFYGVVADDLGIMRGSFAFHMTIFTFFTGLAAFVIPTLMKKFPYKLLLTLSVGLAVLATIAMGYVHSLPAFYLLGAIRGITTSMFSLVPLSMIINNWFEKSHGTAISIVFASSGLAGAVGSAVLSRVIRATSWQMGYLAAGIIILVLCLPGILLPFKLDPYEEGKKPYGGTTMKKANKTVTYEKQHFHFSNPTFIALFIAILAIAFTTSLAQHFPGYAQTINLGTIGGLMLSASMIGNIVFKVVIGLLTDAFGALKSALCMMLITLTGLFLLLFVRVPFMMIVGALMFGACYSVGAVGGPLLTHYFFKDELYDTIYPPINFISNTGAAISLSAIGYIYDFFKSYQIAFVIIMILVCIAIAALFLNRHKSYR